MQKISKNLIYTLIIGIVLLFMAIIISFIISQFLPGDPVLAYISDPSDYNEAYKALGYDKPLIQQFIIFVFRMFSGDWGKSLSIVRGLPVHELFMLSVPRSIDVLIVPLIYGLLLGLVLGYLSVKSRFSLVNRLIQIASLLIFAFPIFLLDELSQFSLGYIFPIFPTTGYKNYALPNPPVITGFRIIDSLLSGQFTLIPDYFYHLALPWITLTISITGFMIILVRIYLLHQLKHPTSTEKRSIVPFTLLVGLGFGTIFAFLMITEISFGLAGTGQLFVQAIITSDYWVLLGTLFIIFFSFIIVITISLLVFIWYGFAKNKSLFKRFGITPKEHEVVSI